MRCVRTPRALRALEVGNARSFPAVSCRPTRGPGCDLDVVIVGPNLAIDSYYVLGRLSIGDVNRASQVLHRAGGKAINMARAVVALGGRALLVGLVGGRSGQFIADELRREGIAHDLVWVAGDTRRSCALIEPDRMQTTVVLETGSPCGQAARTRLTEQVLSHGNGAPYLALTGSLPPGFPAHYYRDLIRQVMDASAANVCLDSAGKALRFASVAGPKIIKVNKDEFLSAFGAQESADGAGMMRTFSQLRRLGVETLVITDGPQGAYVFSHDHDPMRVVTQVRSWVTSAGAGDAFMAGLLLALARGESLPNAAALASATAAANLQKIVCGELDRSDVERFLIETHVEALS